MNRNRALWIAQGLLAVFFLFVGFSKLTASPEVLATIFPLPAAFIRVIGVCEVLGGLGLVLPLALRIRPELTSLAAAGLTIIMVGATVVDFTFGYGAVSLMPLVLGVITALIAYHRRPANLAARQATATLAPASYLPPLPPCSRGVDHLIRAPFSCLRNTGCHPCIYAAGEAEISRLREMTPGGGGGKGGGCRERSYSVKKR
jgi:hypothetical protein